MIRLLIVCLLTGTVLGCATSPSSPQQPAPAPSSQTQPLPQAPTQPSPKKEATTPPPQNQQKSVATPPAEPKPSKDLIQKGQILVSKEKYQQTFEDVHTLIDQLNTIIADRDYDAWTQHLTHQYIMTFSDPKRLAEISDQPMLKRQNIRLLSLRDYFLDVVVPSRANARLDDLEFTSKTQVQAITVIAGQRYILYNLRLEDGSWKIAVS